ncbi:hypothetical protein FNV43_RR20495 [Rhamnella rubrinervis]|uniref:Transmembrane protein 45A n=1 Tax=Rhamnella rubrinervis TaxID=2594499 RepID=A0A8K0GTF8_9ROSA|nr:hypothetical protein FNV43_RR20495 [Rhamnella rubrinervis]
MGSLIGHVLPGFGFFLIGLWHLFNHIKLHALHPNSFVAPPWFPYPKFKYLELYFIMGGCLASIAMELFIGPDRHHPFDTDGTVPSYHLRNFEHSSISLAFFTYAAFAIVLDRIRPKSQHGLTHFLGAIAFTQEFFLFRLHSTDHMGLEGQYHLLLQFVVVVSLITALMGIGCPKSFIVVFVRSLSIFFQGVWFMVTGFMLWIPGFVPKGCALKDEDGHLIVRCSGEEALTRGKSLVNIMFSWFLVGIAIFGVYLYLVLIKIYGKKVEYFSLKCEEDLQLQGEEFDDVESQKKNPSLGASKNFASMEKPALLLADLGRPN